MMEIIKMPHWKDMDYPDKYGESQINALVHRNKYLFNGSSSFLECLKEHDQEYLKILIEKYGYDKDEW